MIRRAASQSLVAALLLLIPAPPAMADTKKSQVIPSPEDAIGALENLPDRMRRAFEDSPDFHPLPRSGPHDWLTHHPEPGQTFDQFLRTPHHAPGRGRTRLYLLPLGEFPSGRSPKLELLREFSAAFFSMDVELLPALDVHTASIAGRRHPSTGQNQLDARDILRLLGQRLPEDAFALLGITMVDLYPDPSWNFVFGLASPSDRVGVFSFARYDPGFYGEAASEGGGQLLLRRSCKVLAHEMGHMFGLGHCVFFQCLMNGSNHLAESDARPLHVCPLDLRKLQQSIGFEPAARYRRLLDFSRKAGFEDESGWLMRRLGYLEGTVD